MTKKRQRLTTEEVIRRSKEKYGDRFTYERTEFTVSKMPFIVTCKKHNDFYTRIDTHLKGLGCPKCSYEAIAEKRKMCVDEFKKLATARYQGKYDYSLVSYKNIHTKVKIICPVHHIFNQTPNQHLTTKGCMVCTREKQGAEVANNRAKTYLEDISKVHGNKYGLEKVSYKNSKTHIAVNCTTHGDFHILPSDFLRGSGCQRCAKSGYDRYKPGILYVLSGENVTKVGITNKRLKQRVQSVSNTSGKNFSVLHTYEFKDGEIPFVVEAIILGELKNLYLQPEYRFDGFTECFLDVNQPFLLTRIEQLIQEHTEAQTKQ